MEYLEGETLADRLAKGALPLEQALRYGIEIADALDKAHRQGIVHRDLKPGNIMLTKSGAKLLDFGLAKLRRRATPSASESALSDAADAAADLTREGTILGTFQYMAPEQLEGKEADARTDIFAFGAVLYEMATGQKAFEGEEPGVADRGDPARRSRRPISTVQPLAPPALDRVVRTCLAKDPDERWQSARDVCSSSCDGSREGAPVAAIAGAASPRRSDVAAHRRARRGRLRRAARGALRAAWRQRPTAPRRADALRGLASAETRPVPDGGCSRSRPTAAGSPSSRRPPTGRRLLWMRALDSLDGAGARRDRRRDRSRSGLPTAGSSASSRRGS